MTYAQSIPIAKELAERQLQKGFDVEAFLILSEINRLDAIPESEIDNHISDIGQMFIEYYYQPSTDTLGILLDSLIQTVSEIYHSVGSMEEKTLFQAKIQQLENIIV